MEGAKGTGLTERTMDEVFVILSQYQQEIASVIARVLSDAYRRGFEDGKKQQQCDFDQPTGEKRSIQQSSGPAGTPSGYRQTTGNNHDWQGGGEPDSSGRE